MESTEDAPADIESKEVEKQELEENKETPDELKIDEVKIDEVKIDEVKIDGESPKEVTKAADDIFENVSDDDGDIFANPTVETVEIAKKPLHTESDLFDDVSEGEDLFDNTVEEEASKKEHIFEEASKEEHIFEEASKEEHIFEEASKEEHIFEEASKEEHIFEEASKEEHIFEEASKEEHIFGIDEDDQKDDKDDLAGIDDKDLFTGNSQQCDLFDDDDDDDDDEDTIESNMQGAIPVRMNSDHDQVPFNTPAVGCALDDARTTALLNAAKESAQQNLQKTETLPAVNGETKKSKVKVNIAITSFTRIGEGYNSYIVYTIQATSEASPETTVQRRFSDFVVLHQLLIENYLPRGVIVPPAPEKNFMGTAKVRFGGNNQSAEDQSHFIRRRKAALERYLKRLMGHYLICKDETLRRFMQEEDPPRPNPNASGIKGFMKNMESMVSKVTARINEVDEWYEDKQQHILELEETLKKLLVVVDNMVGNRRDLANKSGAMAASCLHLGEGEDNASLRRAVTKLSELETKMEAVHVEQSDNDLFTFGETIKDYISIIQSAKAAFDERVKIFSTWESAQSTLAKKREAKNKATAQGRADRVAQCEEDIKFWEGKVEKCQEDFELISKNLKDEIRIFEEVWVREVKEAVTAYFQKTIDCQKQIVGHWKEFLPEAKIIN
ncbi:sorting nexin-2-like [Bolinopsis microptera]|uniref:sorting nexin-2-like n=1 Tax=Bolinopsis microptera TaxID=2820187 RepID=UPI00307944F6